MLEGFFEIQCQYFLPSGGRKKNTALDTVESWNLLTILSTAFIQQGEVYGISEATRSEISEKIGEEALELVRNIWFCLNFINTGNIKITFDACK